MSTSSGGAIVTRPGTGTSILKRESEQSETKANIASAMWFSVLGDFVYFLILVIVALLGWVSVVPAMILMILAFVGFVFWFFNLPKFFVVRVPWVRVLAWRPFVAEYAPLSFASSREITLKLSSILALASSFVYGEAVWNWITAYGAVGDLITSAGHSFFSLPWWVFAIAGGGLFGFVVFKQWKQGVTIVSLLATAWGIYSTAMNVQVANAWAMIVARARFIAVPFVLPWIVGSIMVMIAAAKNILFPYYDFNLKPIGIEDARELGLLGLWMPRLLGGPIKEPVPDRLIKVEVLENGGHNRQYADLPGTPEFIEFCKELNRGGSFALRTALASGVTRKMYTYIRNIFFARGWARWTNEKAKRQGIDLLRKGRQVVENIALDRSVN